MIRVVSLSHDQGGLSLMIRVVSHDQDGLSLSHDQGGLSLVIRVVSHDQGGLS